jgi:hypothetical protein
VTEDPYGSLRAFVGDIHNHCGISYGHGTIEDAFGNARSQLDFASVTGHGHWHDIPADLPPDDYHREGFERLRRMWPHVQDVTESFHEPGSFVTFLSFEWHSMTHGDYCVYFNGSRGEIIRADGLQALRDEMRRLERRRPPGDGHPASHRLPEGETRPQLGRLHIGVLAGGRDGLHARLR